MDASSGRAPFALAVAAALASGCGTEVDPASAPPLVESGTSAVVTPSSDATLGFETTAAWKASYGRLVSYATRTQGKASVGLTNPANDVDLFSAPVSSTSTALQGLSDAGASFAVDVLLPTVLANASNPGSLQLFVSSPSRGITAGYVGMVQFWGQKLGTYRTALFPIPETLRAALAGGSFSDLVFDVRVHAPGQVAGTYLFDNLRVRSSSTRPVGAGRSADLTAIRTYSPDASTPGLARFDAGPVQVPGQLHVKAGGASNGTATLDLGFGTTPFTTCTFTGDGAVTYALATCTGGIAAGDLVGADYARLTVVSGDASAPAGKTKVVAQLAIAPLGDLAGSGLLPPMPTWWGDKPAEADAIGIGYMQAVAALPIAPERRFVVKPVPLHAKRTRDPAPWNYLNGTPPPPNDPPFHEGDSLTDSDTWNASWDLEGTLSFGDINHATTHLDATLSTAVLLWGHRIEIGRAAVGIDADNGQFTQTGTTGGGTGSGTADLYLFNVQVEPTQHFDTGKAFDIPLRKTQSYPVPAFTILVFSVNVGVYVSAGVNLQGAISPAGVNVTLAPSADVGALVEANVSALFVSGGVRASVSLMNVSTPITAATAWTASTTPTDCNVWLNYNLGGDVVISAGGGKVELVGSVGVCPLCWEDTTPVFSWDPLAEKRIALFATPVVALPIALPHSWCFVDLQPTIAPLPSPVTAQVGFAATGLAVRPASQGVNAFNVPCTGLSWSVDGGGTVSPATGCTTTVTVPSGGAYTLRLDAVDQYGETGYTTAAFTAANPPAGFAVAISPSRSPYVFVAPGTSQQFTSSVLNGTPPYTYAWTLDTGGGTVQSIGSGSAVDVLYDGAVQWLLTLTVTDSASPAHQGSAQVAIWNGVQ